MNAPAPARLLVVEDDESLRLGLTDNLEEQGYDVAQAADVKSALQLCEGASYDVMILDVMLPDGDGYQLCRTLRDQGHTAMVLMLTARTLETDLIQGFDAGADDYLTKPYRLSELLARVAALLRRQLRSRPENDRIVLGDLVIDKGARTITRAGAEVSLTKTEFDLFLLLLANESRVLSRTTILDEVWGANVIVEARTVDNFVSSLKRKLDPSRSFPFRIQTLRGVGYRFERG